MKAMLLRVAIDKGTGGALGPIFEDGSFEYIPIDEHDEETNEIRTYGSIIGRKGKPFSYFLPKRLRDRRVHYDPEFETFTYGDPTVKRMYLLKLEKDDLLVFYAGLTPFENYRFEEGLYIIGYFVIDKIIDINGLTKSELYANQNLYQNNAHFKRRNKNDVVIAVGSKNDSELLKQAIPISKIKYGKNGIPYHAVSDKMENELGISGSIQRSIPARFIVDKKYLNNLNKILR